MQKLAAGKTGRTYPPEVRSFALTLHFYSPRAYEYVRRVYQKKLPAQRTLQKWYESINGQPGCSKEAITAIKIKTDEAKCKNKKIIANLVMDEVSIRKHIEYNKSHKKFYGYVDFGNKHIDDNTVQREAKEALTFMVTAVNDHWKIPVAYFLVNGLTSNEKSNILKEVLIFLTQSDIVVSSVTFDGAATNLSMAKLLGAQLNPEKMTSYFKHPVTNENVYIFLDICHMLKLVRNTMASKLLVDGDGNLIMWSYIDKLEKLQNLNGIRLANKINSNHINFDGQKMKTKLAAQTLSLSVAASLNYLKKSNDSEFQNCEATANFLTTFNNIFDMCNSKSKFSRKFKRPFRKNTYQGYFDYIDHAIEYIKGLKIYTETGEKFILNSNCKTRFLGFIMALNNFKLMYVEYCQSLEPKLEYMLTFKFSQDHLEQIFAIIRSRGGWNNNPTALQFASAYKRMLIHNELKSSKNANCIDACQTSILTVSSSNINVWSNEINNEDLLSENSNDSEILYLNPLVHDTVVYISGFVQRKIFIMLKCYECLTALKNGENEQNTILIDLKQFSGCSLTKPIKDIVTLCKIAEKQLSIYEHSQKLKQNSFFNKLIADCFRNVPTNILNKIDDHILDCNPLENHKYLLIKLIFEQYLNIKLYHVGKSTTLSFQKKSIRQKYNKTVIFSGQ